MFHCCKVLGSCWYLLSIERQEECWKRVCSKETDCHNTYLDCHTTGIYDRRIWFGLSNITTVCTPDQPFFQFGIYADALTYGITDSRFLNKYFYCLWWGLRNLSSLGQNLFASTNVGEIMFAILTAILGLVLFALLIGNMQVRMRYWQ